ncbi:hypothetical protein DSO57_1026246 [Entomophthora muscae]|uniref:Uncharacterized protein n=1 Tax=Entomophthora muscae TaxID=34485 RepID=A0ACC2UMM4_9FUNG|nr:hypothetical protein DSO57_1026246 [Entomophthora muscae]
MIDSALPVAGPWAVAGKALSYLVKLGPIIWWAMSVPASAPPSPEGASQYSWYSDSGPYLLAWWSLCPHQTVHPSRLGILTPCLQKAGNSS